MKLPMTLIMTPVELISKFTKPFALAIRLFANMTAGHVVLLAFIGLIFTFHSWSVAVAPVLDGRGDQSARADGGVPASVHLLAPGECVHRAGAAGGALVTTGFRGQGSGFSNCNTARR